MHLPHRIKRTHFYPKESYLNTKLRDFYPTLDALCDDLQIDGGEVSRRLAAIDCRYSPERNQFVSC